MAQVFQYDATYGVQTDFYFTIEESATDLYAGTDVVAGDATISKDGGAVVATTNTPAQITVSGHIYKVTLTATEMAAEKIIVAIRDQTATEIWRPANLIIDTVKRLGGLVVDAAARGGNTTAISALGLGTAAGITTLGGLTGAGLACTGGADAGTAGIAATGSTTGAGILATGGTSGSGISAVGTGTGHGYSGTAGASGKICNFFETVEGTQPAAALADNAQFGAILQWLKRRLHGKSTCTATQLKVYKDDEATVLTTQTVADDGTTQTTGVAT